MTDVGEGVGVQWGGGFFYKLYDFMPDRFIFSGMVKIRGIGKQTRHYTFQNTVLI